MEREATRELYDPSNCMVLNFANNYNKKLIQCPSQFFILRLESIILCFSFCKAENACMHIPWYLNSSVTNSRNCILVQYSIYLLKDEFLLIVICELPTTWHIANLTIVALRTWMWNRTDSHCSKNKSCLFNELFVHFSSGS